MSKELFMAAHEELVEEYLVEHPNATWDEAYEATADGTYEHMREKMFDQADYLRMKAKEGG